MYKHVQTRLKSRGVRISLLVCMQACVPNRPVYAVQASIICVTMSTLCNATNSSRLLKNYIEVKAAAIHETTIMLARAMPCATVPSVCHNRLGYKLLLLQVDAIHAV
jgi:hypothetical protein